MPQQQQQGHESHDWRQSVCTFIASQFFPLLKVLPFLNAVQKYNRLRRTLRTKQINWVGRWSQSEIVTDWPRPNPHERPMWWPSTHKLESRCNRVGLVACFGMAVTERDGDGPTDIFNIPLALSLPIQSTTGIRQRFLPPPPHEHYDYQGQHDFFDTQAPQIQ